MKSIILRTFLVGLMVSALAVSLSAQKHANPIGASLEREAQRLASTLVTNSVPGASDDCQPRCGRAAWSPQDRQADPALAVVQASGSRDEDDEPARSRVSADRLLAGQGVAVSFEALERLLYPGAEVVVTDHGGRARRGKVVSISREQLVIASPVASGRWEALLPLYFPVDLGFILKRRLARSPERAFTEASVARIDIVDPTKNGSAIGAVVGAGFVAGVYLWERRQPDSSLKGLATSVALLWGFPVSLRVGHVLDRAINEPIYTQQSGHPQVTISPWLGEDLKGVIAQVRF